MYKWNFMYLNLCSLCLFLSNKKSLSQSSLFYVLFVLGSPELGSALQIQTLQFPIGKIPVGPFLLHFDIPLNGSKRISHSFQCLSCRLADDVPSSSLKM